MKILACHVRVTGSNPVRSAKYEAVLEDEFESYKIMPRTKLFVPTG